MTMETFFGEHNTTILPLLDKDRNEEDSYCDVMLEVEGENFNVHRCLLGSLSSYFNKLFKCEMKEKYDRTVHLKKFSPDTIKTVLDFIYTTKVIITEENAILLLEAADYFFLHELKRFSSKFLISTLTVLNCLQLRSIGEVFHCEPLQSSSEEVVVKHFRKVVKQPNFKTLSNNDLNAIIQALDQQVVGSKHVYEGILTWFHHDYDGRKRFFADLFVCVKLHLLPTKYLQEKVAQQELVKSSHVCKDHFMSETLYAMEHQNRKEPVFERSSSSENEDNGESENCSSGSMDQEPKTSKQNPSRGGRGGSQQQHGGGFVPKIIKKILIQRDPDLNKAENAWKPSIFYTKSSAGSATEEEQTEQLLRKVRSTLNKLTPTKFSVLMQKFQLLPINTEIRLREVINLIFEGAIDQTMYCEVYANMCRIMSQFRVTTSADGTQIASQSGMTVQFRKILLLRCQREFEKDRTNEKILLQHRKKVEEAKTTNEKQLAKQRLEVAEAKERRRMLGNIRFIGELFKLNMLTESIMHNCIMTLFKSHEVESLESLCRLLTTIGKDLDHPKGKNRMDQYFNAIDKIIRKRKTSNRIGFMLMDVAELRQNKWVQRAIKPEGPKTIDQIHADAREDKQQQQLHVAPSTKLQHASSTKNRGILKKDPKTLQQGSPKDRQMLQGVPKGKVFQNARCSEILLSGKSQVDLTTQLDGLSSTSSPGLRFLDCYQAMRTSPVMPVSQQPVPSTSSTKKVIIIKDPNTLQDVTKDILQSGKSQVDISAQSGRSASTSSPGVGVPVTDTQEHVIAAQFAAKVAAVATQSPTRPVAQQNPRVKEVKSQGNEEPKEE